MGREVRRVPKNWNHSCGPLLEGPFSERLKEWGKGKEMWNKGFIESWKNYPKIEWKEKPDNLESESYEEYTGKKPIPDDYMPEWPEEEKTHYQMYETCSEGTPISPVMETPEELARWLTDNNASALGGDTASYEAWLKVAKGNDVCSAVLCDGVLKSGVEALK